ncbi:hypothetical protein EC844_11928 [Acinetobacter calcoaceticus]|uniref:Uncharacterized protein n=1 Tax=Acinetobacter calcoaceticus TaxID=471 RepID=A0A4R1XIS0_ACICA|nr:hypothetical protein EC844_11928 [Acinetobacter calcoaceticus]
MHNYHHQLKLGFNGSKTECYTELSEKQHKLMKLNPSLLALALLLGSTMTYADKLTDKNFTHLISNDYAEPNEALKNINQDTEKNDLSRYLNESCQQAMILREQQTKLSAQKDPKFEKALVNASRKLKNINYQLKKLGTSLTIACP